MDIIDKVAERVTADDGEAAVEDAFFYEMYQKFIRQELDKFFKNLDQTLLKIQHGEWPPKMEYKVMRYKPMGMTDQEFREHLVDEYLSWKHEVQGLIRE